MLGAGAAGFVLKHACGDDIHRAVRAVAAGRAWLDPEVAGRVVSSYRRGVSPSPASARLLQRLTERERAVLRLMARGHTNAEIADALKVGEATVKTHVGAIFAKLHLRDRPAAIVFAFDHRLVEPRVE